MDKVIITRLPVGSNLAHELTQIAGRVTWCIHADYRTVKFTRLGDTNADKFVHMDLDYAYNLVCMDVDGFRYFMSCFSDSGYVVDTVHDGIVNLFERRGR